MRVLIALLILAAPTQPSWKRFEFKGVSLEAPADYVSAVDHEGNRFKLALANGGGGAILLERNPEPFASHAACLADQSPTEELKACRLAGERALCRTVKSEDGSQVRFGYVCLGATEWKLVVSFDTAAEMDRVLGSLQVSKH